MEQLIKNFVNNKNYSITVTYKPNEKNDPIHYKITGEKNDEQKQLKLFATNNDNNTNEKFLIYTHSIIPACSCRKDEGFEYGWCGVAGGGIPACDH